GAGPTARTCSTASSGDRPRPAFSYGKESSGDQSSGSPRSDVRLSSPSGPRQGFSQRARLRTSDYDLNYPSTRETAAVSIRAGSESRRSQWLPGRGGGDRDPAEDEASEGERFGTNYELRALRRLGPAVSGEEGRTGRAGVFSKTVS